jgi:hypothetical protein
MPETKEKKNKKDGTGRMTERGKETTDKSLPISVSTHLVHVHSHCHTTRNIYINHPYSLHFAFQCLKRSGLGYASRSTQHFSGGRRWVPWLLCMATCRQHFRL